MAQDPETRRLAQKTRRKRAARAGLATKRVTWDEAAWNAEEDSPDEASLMMPATEYNCAAFAVMDVGPSVAIYE